MGNPSAEVEVEVEVGIGGVSVTLIHLGTNLLEVSKDEVDDWERNEAMGNHGTQDGGGCDELSISMGFASVGERIKTVKVHVTHQSQVEMIKFGGVVHVLLPDPNRPSNKETLSGI